MIPCTRHSLAVPDGTISWLGWEQTAAPTLHFAHANGFNAQTYIPLLAPLAARMRVLAMDARGHGFTRLPTGKPLRDWTPYRDDLARFLAAATIGPVILIGHSMGAVTSARFAAQFPDKVAGLMLIEPVFIPLWLKPFSHLPWRPKNMDLAARAARRRDVFPSRDALLDAWRGRGGFRTWPEEFLQAYADGGLLPAGEGGEIRTACTAAWEANTFRTAPFGADRIGGQIKCPVTLLHAEHTNVPGQACRNFARRHGDTRLISVPGTTHFLPMERPDLVREEITRLIARIGPPC